MRLIHVLIITAIVFGTQSAGPLLDWGTETTSYATLGVFALFAAVHLVATDPKLAARRREARPPDVG